MKPASPPSTASRINRLCLLLLAVALMASVLADFSIQTRDPWPELGRIAWGLITPRWHEPWVLLHALANTLAFALLAIAIAAPLGLLLALGFRHWPLRALCAAIRSVHEIFWGLVFIQVFGISTLTGLLAIAVPFTGMFAKVFAEIFEQQSPLPALTLSPSVKRLSRYSYTLIPQAWPALASYSRYRLECAVRSSAILGFIGLPTLGFHLESTFKQGHYSEAAALLWVFVALIASMRLWLKPRLLAPLLLAAVAWLCWRESPAMPGNAASLLWRFVSEDIWPAPLKNHDWPALWHWLGNLFSEQVWPGLWETLLLTQVALALTGVFTLLMYPFATRRLAGRRLRWLGRFNLLVLRSLPEMMLAFILLLLFGPSGLPVVLALALHNAALIAFLLANDSDQNTQRAQTESASAGIHDHSLAARMKTWAYLETPQRFPALLAFLFYRWEVMLRESAIMGIFGVATLGFYIDSAFEEIRYDRAFLLIVVTVCLNLLVDGLSRRFRQQLVASESSG